MQADNASDNKNLAMYAVCEVLRDLGIFRKVKYSFLPVGHTHEDVDASFGCLSRALRKTSWGLTKLMFVKVNLLIGQNLEDNSAFQIEYSQTKCRTNLTSTSGLRAT